MNDSIEIRPLSHTSLDELYAAHKEAFKDYPLSWSEDAYRRMLGHRGYDPALSFGAFHNDQLVSYTLNGIGIFNSICSAYDTGTGTIEVYRGRGLAARVFEHSVSFLKDAGAKQYILEVLEENTTALSVYKKQGFNVTRLFNCFKVNTSEWSFPAIAFDDSITLREIDMNYREEMEKMIDFDLSWQNSFESLLRAPDHFVTVGAFDKERLAGYGIIEPNSGDIPLLAVAKDRRRKGIGTLLLHELKTRNNANIVKVINIESNQEIIKHFLIKRGIPQVISQYEMIRPIV